MIRTVPLRPCLSLHGLFPAGLAVDVHRLVGSKVHLRYAAVSSRDDTTRFRATTSDPRRMNYLVPLAVLLTLVGCGGPHEDRATIDANNPRMVKEAARIAQMAVGESRGRLVEAQDNCQYSGSVTVVSPHITVIWDPQDSEAALDDLEAGLISLGYTEGKSLNYTSLGGVANVRSPYARFSKKLDGSRFQVQATQYRPDAASRVDPRTYSWVVGNRVNLTLEIHPNGC